MRLLCRCIIGAFIIFVIWYLSPNFWRSLLSFFSTNSPWIGFLGGGIVVCFLTLSREFYVERKQHLAILNYALQTLEAQRIILLGFKGDIKKAQGDLEFPFRPFLKQSVEGYRELAEKLIFIGAHKKYNNVIYLLHDMAKNISELDYSIEYSNEKINQYRQKPIPEQGFFEERTEVLFQLLAWVNNILAEIRRGLRVLKNFGKWYFFFYCKIAQPKLIKELEGFMPTEDLLKPWLDTICPEG